jgi:hypothetical protein
MEGPSLNMPNVQQGFEQFEQGLKENLDLDVQADILSWLDGEFGIYMTYNKTSDIAVASKNQWPFDSTLVVSLSDPTKATSTIEKINATFSRNGIKPVTVSDGLYTMQGQSPLRIGYGVTQKSFVLTTGTGLLPAADAINGKDNLAAGKNPAWKNMLATLPKGYNTLLYLDLGKINSVVTPLIASSKLPAKDAQDAKTLMAILNQFESAGIYSRMVDNNSGVASFELMLK